MGIVARKEIIASDQKGMIMYPCLTPKVNRLPPPAGPDARPSAETLVATPFKVPRRRRLLALFVNMMVDVGKENVPANPRMTRSMMMAVSLAAVVGSREMKGVMKKMMGKMWKEIRRQRRTPRERAIGGKMTNWTNTVEMENVVKIRPMRCASMPNPPANLKGSETAGSSIGCGGWCMKTGRSCAINISNGHGRGMETHLIVGKSVRRKKCVDDQVQDGLVIEHVSHSWCRLSGDDVGCFIDTGFFVAGSLGLQEWLSFGIAILLLCYPEVEESTKECYDPVAHDSAKVPLVLHGSV